MGLIKSSSITAAKEFTVAEMVLSPALKMPAIKRPGTPGYAESMSIT